MNMKIIILTISFFLSPLLILSQSTDSKKGTIKVRKPKPAEFYVEIDYTPEYKNGNLQDAIYGNMEYPKEAKNRGIGGIVIVEVITTSQGQITWAKVKDGVEASLDAEALRLVKNLQNFKPVVIEGRAVPVQFTIPIKFTP